MIRVYVQAGTAILKCPDHGPGPAFVWQAGSEHADHHKVELACFCGKALEYHVGLDPWEAQSIEVEGEPHKP